MGGQEREESKTVFFHPSCSASLLHIFVKHIILFLFCASKSSWVQSTSFAIFICLNVIREKIIAFPVNN